MLDLSKLKEPQIHTLTNTLKEIVKNVLSDLGWTNIEPLLSESKTPEVADYQYNCVFKIAKQHGLPIEHVSSLILAELNLHYSNIGTFFGSGKDNAFLNVHLHDGYLLSQLDKNKELWPNLGGLNVLIDYSSPNCAKKMHVGHLRSTVIGDALAGILERSNAKVSRVNHLGDWGTPFGIIIEEARLKNLELSKLNIDEIETIYKSGATKFKDTETPEHVMFATNARTTTNAMQNKEEPYYSLWQTIRKITIDEIQSVYDLMNVNFKTEHYIGESFYHDMIPAVIQELQDAEIIEDSNGAFCYLKSKEPFLLVKSAQLGGGVLYGATDAAALKFRSNQDYTNLIYVVDERQAGHFKNLFEIGKASGWTKEIQTEHAAFGVMVDKNGQPFKTRSGGAFFLKDLIKEATDKAYALTESKAAGVDPEILMQVSKDIGIGALKYGDLSKPRTGAVKFDLDQMCSLSGNTAPYLQYARARAIAIINKAKDLKPSSITPEMTNSERTLILELCKNQSATYEAATQLMPHLLCDHLYNLTVAFGKYYESNPVIENGEVYTNRLQLCDQFQQTLKEGLNALSIASPDMIPRAIQLDNEDTPKIVIHTITP